MFLNSLLVSEEADGMVWYGMVLQLMHMWEMLLTSNFV